MWTCMVNEVAAFNILLDRGYGHRALSVCFYFQSLFSMGTI